MSRAGRLGVRHIPDDGESLLSLLTSPFLYIASTYINIIVRLEWLCDTLQCAFATFISFYKAR